MPKRYTRIDGHKVRTIARVRKKSLRSIAKELSVEWSKFFAWIDRDLGVAPDYMEQIAEFLNVEVHMIALKESYDLKQEALRKLREIDMLVDAGELPPNDYVQAWKVFSPYFLVKPKDIAKAERAQESREELRGLLEDITNAGEQND